MKPYELTLEDERPLRMIPEVPYWSENYAFYGYDYERRTGFTSFIGRWSQDPTLWREQLYVFLPDGTLLLHRAYGRGDCARGPCGGLMSVGFDVPNRWHHTFDGPARHETLGTLMREPIKEGHPKRISVTIDAQGLWPVLMLPTTENGTYGRWHFEQMFKFSGEVRFDGKRFPMEGHGYRDHTRGPRKLTSLAGHLWLQLLFPNGTAFSAYHVWATQEQGEAQVLDEAVSIRPGGFGEAKLLTSPRLVSANSVLERAHFVVQVEDRELRLDGAPLATVVSSFTEDMEFFYGYCPSLARFSTFDQPFVFEDQGQLVLGYLQRSLRNHPL